MSDGERRAADPLQGTFMIAWTAAFAETRNPLYAMHAVLEARLRGERTPAWAEDEMARIAHVLLGINAEYWNERRNPKAAHRALAKVPAALGLSRSGWNAFVAAAADNDTPWTDLDLEYAKRFEKKELARAELVAKWNKISVSTVRKRAARARKLKLAQD